MLCTRLKRSTTLDSYRTSHQTETATACGMFSIKPRRLSVSLRPSARRTNSNCTPLTEYSVARWTAAGQPAPCIRSGPVSRCLGAAVHTLPRVVQYDRLAINVAVRQIHAAAHRDRSARHRDVGAHGELLPEFQRLQIDDGGWVSQRSIGKAGDVAGGVWRTVLSRWRFSRLIHIPTPRGKSHLACASHVPVPPYPHPARKTPARSRSR